LPGVPPMLRERSGLEKHLYLRDCYDDFVADMLATLPMAIRRTVAIMGTAGVGNSSMLLKLLLDDLRAFGLATRSFYLQAQQNICLCNHVIGDTFCVRFVEADEFSDVSVILFADRKTEDGTPTQHTGASVIFTSFRPSIFKEITKFGRRKVLPVWSAHEQAVFFSSPQFLAERGVEVAQRAKDNIPFFGGSIRSNIDAALANTGPCADNRGGHYCKG
jgi:hypothetical protein